MDFPTFWTGGWALTHHWSKFVFVPRMFLLLLWWSLRSSAAYLAIPKGQMKGLRVSLTPAQNHFWRIALPKPFMWPSKYDNCHLELMRDAAFGLYHWLYRYHGEQEHLISRNLGIIPWDYACSSDLLGNCSCDLLSPPTAWKRLSVTER